MLSHQRKTGFLTYSFWGID